MCCYSGNQIRGSPPLSLPSFLQPSWFPSRPVGTAGAEMFVHWKRIGLENGGGLSFPFLSPESYATTFPPLDLPWPQEGRKRHFLGLHLSRSVRHFQPKKKGKRAEQHPFLIRTVVYCREETIAPAAVLGISTSRTGSDLSRLPSVTLPLSSFFRPRVGMKVGEGALLRGPL